MLTSRWQTIYVLAVLKDKMPLKVASIIKQLLSKKEKELCYVKIERRNDLIKI